MGASAREAEKVAPPPLEEVQRHGEWEAGANFGFVKKMYTIFMAIK
jgi:hypothetical protein